MDFIPGRTHFLCHFTSVAAGFIPTIARCLTRWCPAFSHHNKDNTRLVVEPPVVNQPSLCRCFHTCCSTLPVPVLALYCPFNAHFETLPTSANHSINP